jgi:hypothetical protein
MNPLLAGKPASPRLRALPVSRAMYRPGMPRTSLRFLRFLIHSSVGRDAVDFPSLTSVAGERMFKTARIRRDFRDNKSNQDGATPIGFLIEKPAASLVELADRGLAHGQVAAVGKIETPLVGLGAV